MQHPMTFLIAAMTGLILTSTTTTAAAALVRFDFTGILTFDFVDASRSGSALSGFVEFDTDLADANNLSLDAADGIGGSHYLLGGGFGALAIRLARIQISYAGGTIENSLTNERYDGTEIRKFNDIGTGDGTDSLRIATDQFRLGDGYIDARQQFTLELGAVGNRLFSSNDIAGPVDFSEGYGSGQFYQEDQNLATSSHILNWGSFSLDSFELAGDGSGTAELSEPGTATIAASALLLLAAFRRRRASFAAPRAAPCPMRSSADARPRRCAAAA